MKLRKSKRINPDSVQFCAKLNSDQPLFFNTEDDLNKYLCDYRKVTAIYSMSLFRVEFYNLNKK